MRYVILGLALFAFTSVARAESEEEKLVRERLNGLPFNNTIDDTRNELQGRVGVVYRVQGGIITVKKVDIKEKKAGPFGSTFIITVTALVTGSYWDSHYKGLGRRSDADKSPIRAEAEFVIELSPSEGPKHIETRKIGGDDGRRWDVVTGGPGSAEGPVNSIINELRRIK